MTWKNMRSHVSKANFDSIDYIISIDETGIPSLKNINSNLPAYQIWFTLTGCIFNKDDINKSAHRIVELKEKYWNQGIYHNHRVYLHSRDIRRQQGPFNLSRENYSNFRKDLNSVIDLLPLTICSSTINKLEHVTRYLYPNPVYQLALGFMIERIAMFLSEKNANGILILECRGWREDNELVQQIVEILKTGTKFMSATDLKCIQGVYFENKLTPDGNKSYWPFEISDIVCHRINKYIVSGTESDNFLTIKKKIMGYPNNIQGRGIKLFP